MTQIKDITDLIEAFAPLNLQQSYDNSGLVVGRADTIVEGVLLAVDVTEEVLQEAMVCGANLVITHHPIIFTPLKRFNSKSYVERCVEFAIRHDIALYACHTNLDSVKDGMSWHLANMLGVSDLQVLEPAPKATDQSGFGVVGTLAEECDLSDFLANVAKVLSLKTVRHSAIAHQKIGRVALCTGSGGSLMESVRSSGAQLYITADLKYNDFMVPQESFTVVDIGHFESEYCAIEIIYSVISKKMFNFAVRKSESSCNPVHYMGF